MVSETNIDFYQLLTFLAGLIFLVGMVTQADRCHTSAQAGVNSGKVGLGKGRFGVFCTKKERGKQGLSRLATLQLKQGLTLAR